MQSADGSKQRKRDIRISRRRAEILDAAKVLFLSGEYASVTMDGIADAAAFSRATLYTYFPSKQDIYLEILFRDIDSMITALTDAFDERDTAQVNLRRMAAGYMLFFKDHPEYFTTMSFFYYPGRREGIPAEAAHNIETRLAEGISTIERALVLAVERGEARAIDTRAATLSLWGQWMGTAYLGIAGQTGAYSRSIEQVYAEGVEMFLEGFLKPAAIPGPRTRLRKE